jgi:hypothetical protein
LKSSTKTGIHAEQEERALAVGGVVAEAREVSGRTNGARISPGLLAMEALGGRSSCHHDG